MFRKNLWDKVFDWIFGYDLFISYSRIGWHERYAVDLAKRLTAQPYDFKCFLDAHSMETGGSWKLQGRRSLRTSSKILLLLTPGVLESAGVRDELEYNKSLKEGRKPISLVDIQNTWPKVQNHAEFLQLLTDDGTGVAEILRIEEGQCDKASEAVLDRIKNDFTIRTENARRSYILAVVASVLLVLTAVAAILAGIAKYEQGEADRKREEAQVNQSLLVATLSRNETANNNPVAARYLALKALPERTWDPERPLVNEAMDALLKSSRSDVQPHLMLSHPSRGSGDGGIEKARFTFDGGRLVTYGWYGLIRIWNGVTGALIKDIGEGYGQSAATAMHSGAPLLALARRDRTNRQIDIWNTVEAKIVHTFETGQPVVAVAFDNADRLASREEDGAIRLWNVATGGETAQIKEKLPGTLAMAFAVTGELVTFSKSGVVQKWNAEDGTLRATFDTNLGLVDRVETSPMAELAVVFRAKSPTSYKVDKSRRNDNEPWVEEKHCAPCVAEIWDLSQGISLGTFTEHREALFNEVAISPDLLAIAIRDPLDAKRVLLWNVARREPGPILVGHTSEVQRLAFSYDGRLVGTASWDRTGRVWNASTGKPLSVLRGHGDYVNSIAFDRQGQRVVTGSRDTYALTWPLADPKTAELQAATSPTIAAAFNGDGTILAVSGGRTKKAEAPFPLLFVPPSARCEGKCIVRIWDVKSRKSLFDLETKDTPQGLLRFHPTEKMLFTASRGTDAYNSSSKTSGPQCSRCTVTAWNLVTGAEAYVIKLESGVVSDLELSHDGKLMAVATDAGPIYVFETATGTKIAELVGHTDAVKKIAFHPSKEWLLSGSWDRTIRLWDVKAARTTKIFSGHQGKVGHIQLNTDGTRFVSSSDDDTPRLWDTETGAEVAKFAGHIQAVNQAVFANSESRVITAAQDNSIIIWNAYDGTRIHILSGHANSGAFSGVKKLAVLGNNLLSFGSDGAARLWDIERGVAIDILTRPDQEFSGMALDASQNQLALSRRDGDIQLRLFDRTDVLQQIDRLSALALPTLGTELQGKYGPGATLTLLLDQGDHSALIEQMRLASQSYEAARDAKSALTADALQRLADAGAVEAHVKLAEFFDAQPEGAGSYARAFFHHRVAERIFRMLDRSDEANFHAARRVSLAALLDRSALSKMWREAQCWPNHCGSGLQQKPEAALDIPEFDGVFYAP